MVPIYLYHLLFYLPIAIIISRRKENRYPLTMSETVSWETPTPVKKKKQKKKQSLLQVQL